MGFIGGTADKPAPITDKEAEPFCVVWLIVATSRSRKTLFEPGEMVRVTMVRLLISMVWLKKLITKKPYPGGCDSFFGRSTR